QPTRLDAAKTAVRAFVENQPSTINIGVVAFSNGGLVIQPPTNDQVAVIDTIQRLSPQGNTSLGQGIFTSLNAIAGEPLAIDEAGLEELDEGEMPTYDIGRFPSSVIILLSDGENRSMPDPLQVAQLAAEAGVRIYPVGIGSTAGAVVEIDGFSILTQLDEALLQQLADLTNGQYYHAADEATLEEIYQNIDLRLAISGEETEITSLVAGLSVLLLLIGGGLSMMWFGRIP
ncbi:MAG: VWA domain-containing protein, partial [Anaerolineales bacterium]|nr:VWA domain-containing protein [Anaerolineales bacterium]